MLCPPRTSSWLPLILTTCLLGPLLQHPIEAVPNNTGSTSSANEGNQGAALPAGGVIFHERGVVSFIQGELTVKLELHIREFLVSSAADLFERTDELLRKLGSIALTRSHIEAVIDDLRSVGFHLRRLAAAAGEQLLRRLNQISIREWDREWRQKLTRTKLQLADRAAKVSAADTREGTQNLELRPNIIKREKRGLFDLGGEVLKTVLGVATKGDVEDLRKSFGDANQGITASLKKVNVAFTRVQHVMTTLVDQAAISLETLSKLHHELNEIDIYIYPSPTRSRTSGKVSTTCSCCPWKRRRGCPAS